MSLIGSLKWSAMSELASKVITPLVFIVLARLLTPEDFGVMAAATMVIAFSQIFWEAGMGKALIQRQSDIIDAANAAFFINIALGAGIAAALFLFAGSIAHTFFQDDRVTAVLQLMTLQILLGALSSVQTALLQKEMDFKRLFWVRFATVSLPGLASIPLAIYSFGYWALVAGTITGQAVQVVMLWRISSWRPTYVFNASVAGEMGRFGIWVGFSGLLAWLVMWADALIVGKYLGVHELGVYRTGNQFAVMVFALIFAPIVPVLYSMLTRMDKDSRRLASALQQVIRIIIYTAIPLAVVIFCFSAEIGATLFGANWGKIGSVIGVLALVHGSSWVVGMNGEAYRAYGKPHLETWVTAATLLIYIPAYVYTINIGFDVFVWNRLALAFGAMLLHLYLLKATLGIKALPILARFGLTALMSFALTIVVKYLLVNNLEAVVSQMVIGMGLSGLLIGLLIIVIERNGMVKDIVDLVKGRSNASA